MEQKIPKIIHYVWVGGGKMSDLMIECLTSWKKFCPDYQIIEWNEKNFDLESNPLIKMALSQKNWSLVSDIMRAWILYEHGGIYLDTDIEILKPLDNLLSNEFFMGYESNHWVNTAIIGSVKGHEILDKCKIWYNSLDINNITRDTNLLAVQLYSALAKHLYNITPDGKTTIYDNGLAFYAKDYFYPQHYMTHKIVITPNSHVIHRCSCSWHSKAQRRQIKFYRAVRKIIGNGIFQYFEGVVARKYRKVLIKEFKTLF